MNPILRVLLLVVLLTAVRHMHAAGGLMVDPLRLVFDGSQRTAQIYLMNRGVERLNYRVSFVERRMTENGQLLELDDGSVEGRSAAEMIRFAPRQITLEPGGEQVVKLLLRKPADLEPGEYRSHLLLQPVSDNSTRSIEPEVESSSDIKDEKSVGIGLAVVYGISMPVIVRHGGASATAQITDVALPAGSRAGTLRFAIRREGTASTYGDCTVFVRGHGKERAVGKVAGLAVYPPLALRWVAIPVDGLPSEGELRVEYRTSPSDGGKLLAETIFPFR